METNDSILTATRLAYSAAAARTGIVPACFFVFHDDDLRLIDERLPVAQDNSQYMRQLKIQFRQLRKQ